ncbi:putative leucine-rich repeat-containing protein [Golovinomyces cichoracearum]|uniref:Putative leucine-rich repeat-containing protein n=1 Tax=Golovinomyces cichoracearum TaxID=62708 RepID=A0A420IPJ3_9PEZI|nr:putative leucine-rich repeat-containing protein [Golovinomyces cichoracearum]
MDSEDGKFFIKNLAQFVRTHEKALANGLQMKQQPNVRNGQSTRLSENSSTTSNLYSRSSVPLNSACSSPSSAATTLSLPSIAFTNENIKVAKLALTPHHLFYLLSRFEELGIIVGPMNVRLENLQAEASSGNYVSFLNQHQRPSSGRCSDHGSIHSVSSVRSVFSGMTSLWANLNLGSAGNTLRIEKQKAVTEADLKYLYASFTKIPCLRLAPDNRARLIKGYEEFPFDTAVPLIVFKNMSALEISDIDIRKFFGWDKLAEQLRSLTIKRAGVSDLEDLLINIVLDDMDRRRRRSSRHQPSLSVAVSPKRSTTIHNCESIESNSEPGSPNDQAHHEMYTRQRRESLAQSGSISSAYSNKGRSRRFSPVRPSSSRNGHHYLRDSYYNQRSGSCSSQSSLSENWYNLRSNHCHTFSSTFLPSSKWRFLKHLSLADNDITTITVSSLLPLVKSLYSLDLSYNHFTEIPECLASLTSLRALNLSSCMINSLHSLAKNSLPAITALNLRSNRLSSLDGIEFLQNLERLDIRDNNIINPTEISRLTRIPDVREIWVSGNPFTKSHANSYRVTIFNMFRQTPGYKEDINIDMYAPGYSEKRQLSERVTEKPNLSKTKAPLDTSMYPPQTISKDQSNPSSTGEITTNTFKQNTSSRSENVGLEVSDLSASKANIPSTENTINATSKPETGSIVSNLEPLLQTLTCNTSVPHNNQSKKDISRKNNTFTSLTPPTEIVSIEAPQSNSDSQSWNISENMYRKKLDVLRNEAGKEWLTVLSEDSWDSANVKQAYSATTLQCSTKQSISTAP